MLRDGEIGDKFKCVSVDKTWNGAVYEIYASENGYCVKCQNSMYLLDLCEAAINADWIKLPKPAVLVDFSQAFKAFLDGKAIKSETNGQVFINENHAISFPVPLINGKWTILENT